ncbi:MAG: EAL domain-containing protein [Pseudomonadota bacterium]|nr:MAG: EAL domain-containing protein [Pseudomonadota bacterium]
MLQALKRIEIGALIIIACGLALAPAFGYAIAAGLGIVDLRQLSASSHLAVLLCAHVLLVAALTVYFRRFFTPMFAWLDADARTRAASAHPGMHLAGFSNRYWSAFVLGALLLPTLQLWLGGIPAATNPGSNFIKIITVLSVCAVLVGMPGYLLTLNMLGRLSRYLGAAHVQVSIRTRMLIIGALVPLLASAVLLGFYAWRTDYLARDVLAVWGALGLFTVTLAGIMVYGLNRSLRPIARIAEGGGASTHGDLAQQLRPQSGDEIGYLLHTLSRLFSRLGEQQEHVQAVIEHAAEGIIVTNSDGEIELFNPAAETLFGYGTAEINGRHLRWLLPDVASRLGDPALLAGEHEALGMRRDGSTRDLALRLSRMHSGEKLFYTCLVADISERKAAQQQLRDAEARYRNLVETAHDLVWSVDREGRWTYLNAAARNIYGYDPEAMLGYPLQEFQAPESAERDAQAFDRVLEGEDLVHYETVHVHRDGTRHHLSFNAKPIADETGTVAYVTGTARDITKQKAFEQELTYQAQHDTLTGLYNRKYFYEELNRVLARVARSGADCALFYLDLDQFKYVNDTLGHAAGDRLLLECTALLKQHTREGDLLARFGGDEFTVLLYNVTGPQALTVAEHLRALFEKFRFFENDKYFNITCSVGVALINSVSESPDTVLSHADLACNVAKSQGRNCVHLYSAQDHDQSGMAEDMGWAIRVREACEQDRFELVYQPIVAIADGTTRDYEVLLRMRLDNGEHILPGGFIPAAERFGLMQNVDRWAIENAIAHLSDLHAAGEDTRFAINLSGRALEDRGLLDMINALLRDTRLPPERVTFEITETAAIAKLSAAVDFISRLKDLGCEFALDDFGSGFCSFAYLKHLPVDKLKIDGSFVQGLDSGRVDQAMVQSMNQVAHALGKQTIAESVENANTLALLRDFGIDYAQGNFLGAPARELAAGGTATASGRKVLN